MIQGYKLECPYCGGELKYYDQVNRISSGLPLKGDTKLLNKEVIKSEKGLRTMIHRNMMQMTISSVYVEHNYKEK